jgi:hypothetical protein
MAGGNARICRIEDVALVHAYAQISMLIRYRLPCQRYSAGCPTKPAYLTDASRWAGRALPGVNRSGDSSVSSSIRGVDETYVTPGRTLSLRSGVGGCLQPRREGGAASAHAMRAISAAAPQMAEEDCLRSFSPMRRVSVSAIHLDACACTAKAHRMPVTPKPKSVQATAMRRAR